ncbi:MAG TPA: hypothetical protein VHC69_09015 [Polyangiaceae bacterium]|nr:hypothetical protein [Polyangiaceae bacterium]
MLVRSSLALVVVLGVSGCATSNYRPADSPRVSVAYGGIYKNGKKADGLVDAVADNPRALEEARTAQSLAAWGGGLQLGGLALMIAGLPTVAVAANDNNGTLGLTGVGLLTGALIADVVGIVMSRNAVPHALDAINIYNDEVEAKMFIRRPAPAPTGMPATPTPEQH